MSRAMTLLRVRIERDRSDTLVVTLTRPNRLNALDARMRDELVEAFTVAAADDRYHGRRGAR